MRETGGARLGCDVITLTRYPVCRAFSHDKRALVQFIFHFVTVIIE